MGLPGPERSEEGLRVGMWDEGLEEVRASVSGGQHCPGAGGRGNLPPCLSGHGSKLSPSSRLSLRMVDLGDLQVGGVLWPF